MNDDVRLEEGTYSGIDRATISCRKHTKGKLAHQTGTHKASILRVEGNVIVKVEKSYTILKKT